MTAIGLNSFVSAAHSIPQDGKLTIAEGQVKAHSSTAIAGRLVTWVKQQAAGEARSRKIRAPSVWHSPTLRQNVGRESL